MKFMKLVANNVFPLDNIAFLLFLDNVEWFSEYNLAIRNTYILSWSTFGELGRNYFMEGSKIYVQS